MVMVGPDHKRFQLLKIEKLIQLKRKYRRRYRDINLEDIPSSCNESNTIIIFCSSLLQYFKLYPTQKVQDESTNSGLYLIGETIHVLRHCLNFFKVYYKFSCLLFFVVPTKHVVIAASMISARARITVMDFKQSQSYAGL
jgi:hypothetical protein